MPIPDNQLRIPARSKVPRPVLLAGLMLLAAACGSRSPMEDGLQRRLPLLPEEVLQSFELADGFRLELAASEPNVADPIAMAFDENGRMFVAEMRGYPLDPPPGGEAAGRIRLLEDRDEDGFFETARVFADRLHWPSGIACFDGGVFVTAAPDILYLKDSTGDGAADVRRTVFTGFGTDKSEDIVNNLKWGLDHWIYGTTSYNGGSVRHVERPGDASVPLASSDFRFHPLTEEFEAVEGTRGDFGNAFDAWGNRFASNSGNPVIHAVFPLRHVVEGIEPARLAVPIFESGRLVFPISKPEPWRVARKTYWNRYVDSTHEMRAPRFPPSELATGGYFTGGAGLGIYKGAAYPPEFRGSAFNPEPAGNLVLHSILERSGITFRARRATEGREFLASTDNWFRPVNLVNGPDGCLYLADMYREVIEDPSAIPGEILEHVDYYTGQDMGRIYRIVPNAFAREEVPRLGEASASELVDTLVHEDGWWRSTAQRLLFERRAVDAAPALRALAGDARSPFGRLHALWLLEGLGLLDDTTLLAALADPHPALRQNAIRLSEARLAQSRSLRASVAAMASDEDVGVRFRVALVIPQMNLAGAPAMLASILRRDPGDEWIRAAVFGGARGDSLALLGVLLRDGEFMADPDSPGAVRQLASGVAATQAPESIRSLLRSSRGLPGPRGNAIRMAAASGVAAGLERTGTSLPDLRDGTADSALRAEITAVLAEAPAVALESDASNVGKRVEAIRLLAWALPDAALDALGTILVPDEPAEIQLAAVRSLAARDEHEVGRILLRSWRAYSPAVRREVLEALFSRHERLELFLDALRDGEVAAAHLDTARRAALLDHPREAIRRRARQVLAESEPAAPEAALREYRSAIGSDGSVVRGEEIFARECATCHRLGGTGHDVGPDLTERAASSREDLLVDILDPNRSVRSNFVNYRLDTVDGRVLTGILARESAASVVLRRGEGIEDLVRRAEIDSLVSMGLSLMPEGLQDEIEPREMADLLSFVKAQGRE